MAMEESKVTKMKTTPKEKMIIGLMEEVINILQSVNDLSSPEFNMYIIMDFRP